MAVLEIKKSSILYNAELMKKNCHEWGVSLCGVTKCCCSKEEIATLFHDAGITDIADSNMENFTQLPPDLGKSIQKSLIKTRLSDIKHIPTLPEYARPDRVFVSDEALLEALELLPQNICPEIVLIIEMGDFKEGFLSEQIPEILTTYSSLPITGVSANYACLSGNMPDSQSINLLRENASFIKTKDGTVPLVSLGGTVMYPLLQNSIPQGVRIEFRSGEGILLGYDSSLHKELPGFRQDTFMLYGEIIEVREKDNALTEHTGLNALGECGKPRKPGKRLYAVLDFGILAASSKNLQAEDNGAEIVGQTFDFTVADISESSVKYKTGDMMAFIPSYGAVSFAMMNKYVKQVWRF